MIGHIFVSYSRRNKEFVINLARLLKSIGIPIWLDKKDIKPSQSWSKSIDEAICNCGCFFIVLSQDSVKSEQVNRELKLCQHLKKVIVPVLYESCNIPELLKSIEYVDFRGHALNEGDAFCYLLESIAYANFYNLPLKLPVSADIESCKKSPPIFIAGALFYKDRAIITLANFSRESTVSLLGWYLLNERSEVYYINEATIKPGMIFIVIIERNKWLFSINEGMIKLYDGNGSIVDDFNYKAGEYNKKGKLGMMAFSKTQIQLD